MRSFLLSVLTALLLGGAAVSPSDAKSAAPRAQFRGMWVSAWGKGIKSPAEIERLVQSAKTANLNALLVQVRKRGDAYYLSDYVVPAADIPQGFDPLAMLIQRAHAAGIQVHAWMVMYPAWSDRKKVPPPGHILNVRPNWATYHKSGRRMTTWDGAEGIFLDPGLPEVQSYLASITQELVARYPVDGVHLDYIRYPGRQWGYHPESVRRFKSETGRTPSGSPERWDQWRRDQVTKLVAWIGRVVEATRPSVQYSAAVFPARSESFTARLQDWERWTRAGLVDFVAPMNYATTRSRFASRSSALLRRGSRRPIYMGVGGGNKSEAAVLNQMKLLQAMGAPGIILYHYEGNSPYFWQKVGSRLFQRPARVPHLPWKPRA